MDTSRYAAPNACTPGAAAPRGAHAADGLAYLAQSTAAEAATLAALESLVAAQRQIAASAPARNAARRANRATRAPAGGPASGSVHADEAARNRLARELHDSVGAELAATHFALANVHTWLPANAPPQCAEALALVARSLEAATGAMRHVLDGLHAPHLDEGLAPALANWIRGFAARTGLAARFTGASDDARLARLPADAALAVFRVAQEALANVARHAQATRAEVRLECTARHLTLTVADDGVGLARRAPGKGNGEGGKHNSHGGRYGLAGMRERCAAFGGSLRTASGGVASPLDATHTEAHAQAHTQAHDATGHAATRGTTVRARFAWDALLAAPASPIIVTKGARP
ncbi:histidine kinase-like protein [Paraburkholderia unamae]|uniref:sensor histidine kinase n=1 Tax=Paraburkholderia unamae TaxID=219649 RepID=UPI000DC299FE|nr:histidine kinase [Paraburkholderia unamae]RAR66971.1 histidine kinase-like protein [Paraburkholderia unamae]